MLCLPSFMVIFHPPINLFTESRVSLSSHSLLPLLTPLRALQDFFCSYKAKEISQDESRCFYLGFFFFLWGGFFILTMLSCD